MSIEREIIEGMMRVEAFNDQFRQPNPKGRYPICKPKVGTNPLACERCEEVIDYAKRAPCAAVPPEKRWGEDWVES